MPLAQPLLMRFDIIVATLKRTALLAKTLQSLARAERPRRLVVRIYIVNNDSTAHLPGMESVPDSIPYPTVILHEPRPGKSSALNAGIAESAGDYIGFLDDDETVDPQWFRVIENALAEEDLDFLGGRSLAGWTHPLPAWVPSNYPAVLGITNASGTSHPYGPEFPGMLTGGNAVIRRSTLNRIGPFDWNLGPRFDRRLLSCEDEDMYLRLLDAGARGRYLPNLIVYHHLHPERLEKRYFRAWAFWNGASKGLVQRDRPSALPQVAGVPRYLFGEAARGMVQWVSEFRSGAHARRFAAELSVWHLAGHLYGRHLPRRGRIMTPRRPRPRVDAATRAPELDTHQETDAARPLVHRG